MSAVTNIGSLEANIMIAMENTILSHQVCFERLGKADDIDDWPNNDPWPRFVTLLNSNKCLALVHKPPTSADERDEERALNHLRRYILVVQSSDQPPTDAYVSWNDKGTWYYVSGDDYISQENFTLIAQFMTIQSTVTPNQSLTAVSVGPH